jgi:hypothetical protein
MGKLILAAIALMGCTGIASAQSRGGYGSSGSYGTGSNPSSHGTSGYTTPQGTYVQPHQQTNPNGTQYDNYNSRGNQNPYSGQTGNRSPKY